MTTRTTIIAGALACLVAASAASPVGAQSGPTLRVSYKNAELRTDAGAQAVFQRIERGARRVCTGDPSSISYRTASHCRRELIDLAVAKLADPRVAGMHAGTGPTRIAAK